MIRRVKLEMKKIICLLFIYLGISLCACQKTTGGNESVSSDIEQSASSKDELTESYTNNNPVESIDSNISEEEKKFLDKYNDFCVNENIKRVALIYLDGDSIPELLIIKDGEYRLYSFDGSEITAVDMADIEIKANSYGPKHDFENPEYQTFFWFEYVPYKGLIRVHSGGEQERHDYYLRYTNGFFSTELETKSSDYTWYTYDAEKEITNEEFLSQLSDLGYDELVPCGYLYENVMIAYENIGAVANTQKVLEDFVSGKIDALYYVEAFSDIPEDGFVMRSYEDFYDDVTAGEDDWGSVEYIDFDNDGEDELIIHGYGGACIFFDVIGDTVYEVLETSSTTDVAYIAEIEGKRVIARADVLYAGRKSYRIMKFDSCCCLIDWFHLYAEYEGTDYTVEDKFTYRDDEITMEEFEIILNSIHQL